MINVARNPFVNPFVNPFMTVPGIGGINPFTSQLGWINPFASQLGGVSPFTSQMGGISPLASQMGGFAANLPGGYGATGQFGAPFNPVAGGLGQSQFSPLAGGFGQPQFSHLAGGIGQSQFSHQAGVPGSWAGINPNVAAQAYTNPAILSDPTLQALLAQQIPIRSLTGGLQSGAFQPNIQGLTPQVTGGQWVDPYTAFVQAQLISQLVNNPLFQLSRGYGGAEAGGHGVPFAGQPFQTPLTNYPFGV